MQTPSGETRRDGAKLAIAEALVAAGVDRAAWVPDKRLVPIAARLEELGVPVRTLAREDECVGFAAGYRAAGGLPAVLMQSSGLGHSLNALGSLAIPFGLAFPLVVSMRGTLGERNRSQTDIGRTTAAMLAQLGIQSFSIRGIEEATRVVRGCVDLAEGARQVAAVLLEPELDAEVEA